jgi:hypothetical protein
MYLQKPADGRLRQEDFKVKVSLSYIARPCLDNNNNNNNNNNTRKAAAAFAEMWVDGQIPSWMS